MRFALAPARLRWVRLASPASRMTIRSWVSSRSKNRVTRSESARSSPHQRLAEEHPHDPGVVLRESEHHTDNPLAAAPRRIGLVGDNPVHEPEHRVLGELDERLEHRSLAGKVAVERRLGHSDHAGEARGW